MFFFSLATDSNKLKSFEKFHFKKKKKHLSLNVLWDNSVKILLYELGNRVRRIVYKTYYDMKFVQYYDFLNYLCGACNVK